MSAHPEYLTSEQVAELIGVHVITLSVWRKERRGPVFSSPGDARLVRYLRSDVDKWMAEGRKNLVPDGLRSMRLRAQGGLKERVEEEVARHG